MSTSRLRSRRRVSEPVGVWGRPGGPVSGVVDGYFGYRSGVEGAVGMHRGMPSVNFTFIVSVGGGIDVAGHPDPGQGPDSYRCVVGGLQLLPALIRERGVQEGIAIELDPLSTRSVFGMPAAELFNTSVELDQLVGRVGNELWERVGSVGGWASRFAVCDDVLARMVAAHDGGTVNAELRRAWRLLAGSAGRVSVADLAAEVGWSRQHLTRRFRSEFGLAPKAAGRLVRFDRARRMLQSGRAGSLSQVAVACGYYDQSHLTNDWSDLAGCPPETWLSSEQVPFFQDPPGQHA